MLIYIIGQDLESIFHLMLLEDADENNRYK